MPNRSAASSGSIASSTSAARSAGNCLSTSACSSSGSSCSTSASRSSSKALNTSWRRFAGSSRTASATSTGRCPANCSSSCATPWSGIARPDGVKPCTCCQSTTCALLRRPSRRCGRTATLVTLQSRVRVCSMPRSTTTTSIPASCGRSGSSTRTRDSITCPNTSTSFGRWANRAQRHAAGCQRRRAGLDGGDAQDWYENPSAGEQFDNEPQHTRLVAHYADADHHVADAPDGLAVGT